MTLKDTFTPGPWRAHIAADSIRVSDGVCSADGLHVCDVASYGALPSTIHANALLISAAPELAAALLALVDATNAHCPVDHPALPLARNILRKAGLLS